MRYLSLFFISLLVMACSKKTYLTNGESIYKTGKNLQGEKLLDKSNSRIKFINSCKTCHGARGDAMRNVSIAYSSLTSPADFTIPYTDSLIFRFLDHDLKSDGTKADIGVIWKMCDRDKKDLVDYLKKL